MTVVNVGREHFFSKSQQAFSADQAFAVNCLWDSQHINLESVQSVLMLTSQPAPWGKHKSGLLQTNLISHLLPSVYIHKQISLMWSWRTKFCLKERNRKSLRHHWLPMIFDHLHRIPEATHLLWLCCQDVMSGGSVSFNYSHFSSIYTSAARSFVRKNSLFLRFLRWGKRVSFSSPPFTQRPLCSYSDGEPLHLI